VTRLWSQRRSTFAPKIRYGQTPVPFEVGAEPEEGTDVHIQRVVMPITGIESWTVLGDDGAVVVPVERVPLQN